MTDKWRGDRPFGGSDTPSANSSVVGQEDSGSAPGDRSYRPGPDGVSGDEGYGPPDPGQGEGPPAGDGGRRRRGGAHGASPPRRRGKILMWTAVGTVLVLGVSGTLVYLKLNANLQSAPLDLGGPQAVEKKDPFGQPPLNILLIGSDTRSNRADCRIGGDCGPGQNADVEMVVHLSANRSNATVMSIPRDTIVNVPQCTDSSHHVYPPQQNVQITSSLQDGGPGCTVATVHALTGITIDHFVMIDFLGVVNMADDVGGVPVCVNANVFDPDSHLRLTKGTHVISGMQALEFLRTRHGFLYGGDLYRTQAQHMYLSALIRKMKSASTLANPLRLYRLANDATKAVTVDPGLDSISKLVGLASDLNKVQTERITFLTMPTVPYPSNPTAWVSPAMPAARQLFKDIITDTPLTHGNPAAHPTPAPTSSPVTASPTPSVDKAAVHVSVENGSGIPQRARNIAAALVAAGFTQSSGDTNAPYTTTTRLTYGPGERAQALAVAKTLGLSARTLHRSGDSLTLVIGTDWPSGATYPGSGDALPSRSLGPSVSANGSSTTGSAAPPPGSVPENASRASECAQVNPAYSF